MWKLAAPLLAFTILFLALSLTSMLQKSATVDEVTHIPAGYTYLALGDFRLNPEHPPLVKLLTGLPLLWLKPRIETNDATWRGQSTMHALAFGAKFLYEWNDADRLIFWSRVPVVLLALLLGFGIFICARDLYGWKAGVVALALYLFYPDILAHGQLVTTDLGVSCFLFFSVYAFYRALRRLNVWNVLLTCLCVGLALITKFSGVLVFPMLALVGAAFAFSQTPVWRLLPQQASAEREISSRQGELLVAGALIVVAALSSLVLIWAAYGFRYQLSTDAAIERGLDWTFFAQKPGLLKSLLLTAASWKIVPEAYSYGFLYVLTAAGDRGAFLLGEVSPNGWWYYFLATFLVKTPIPLILLIVSGFFLIRRYGAGLAAEAMLLLPVGLYWAIALTSDLNIGHRHLLPIYPFLIVFASKVARVFEPPISWRLAVPCALLFVWLAVGTVRVYPHFLAYFNEIAGGPAGGYRWLVDSNLDWGQDLKGLARYRQAHPEEPFYLCYFGTASPAYYGIRAQHLPGHNLQTMRQRELARFDQVPPGALVAISASSLQFIRTWGKQFPGSAQFEQRLRSVQPIANVGYSILIYRMP